MVHVGVRSRRIILSEGRLARAALPHPFKMKSDGSVHSSVTVAALRGAGSDADLRWCACSIWRRRGAPPGAGAASARIAAGVERAWLPAPDEIEASSSNVEQLALTPLPMDDRSSENS